MKHLQFWVIGGDQRSAILAGELARDGHTVHALALERAALSPAVIPETDPAGAGRSDCVVLPLPLERGGAFHTPLSERKRTLEEILDALRPGQVICAGQVTQRAAALAAGRGLVLRDYFAREELTISNAVPTAEGAVQLAMEELPITVHGSRVLVLGYGRVGTLTAHRFAALGAKVTVCARRIEARAAAGAMGHATLPFEDLASRLGAFDLVINTVPAPVLGELELAALRPGVPVCDLASAPGGADAAAAARLGVKLISALSLPGRVAPVSAAQYLKNAVYEILKETGV